MRRFEDKIALVTGASRGIGRAAAVGLAEEGADILLNFHTHPEEAAAVVAEIEALGRRAVAYEADVSSRPAMEAMFREIIRVFGRLDIAVANPAYSVRQTVIEAEWNDVHRSLEVSQFGVFHTCQLAARQMVGQGTGGKIVIISSIHAEIPFAGSSAYNMAKAAINHLAATMANELARHRVNVNVVNPGWIDTPGERQYSSEEDLERGARQIPWGRLGTAQEIAKGIAFLASADADYITGSCLRIDGGYSVGLELPPPR